MGFKEFMEKGKIIKVGNEVNLDECDMLILKTLNL